MHKTLKRLTVRGHPLSHYFDHLLLGSLGLATAAYIFGSVTIWEIILFFIFVFLPYTDQFLFCVLNYIQLSTSRQIVNLFLIGNLKQFLYQLHTKRRHFHYLIMHNFLFHFSIWWLWFVFLSFDAAILFYAVSAIQVHLIHDILNDEYEFASLKNWFWPAL